ncbi:MAG: AAA family ATPase [Polyangia bacterium]|jgi:ABC-type ATPase involved in cell division
MAIKSVSLHEFGVFTDLKLDFCDGINVLIGANGTGKTHLLKVLYALHAFVERAEAPDSWEGKLNRVFRPDHIGRLVHRRVGVHSAKVACVIGGGHIDFSITTRGKFEAVLRAATIGAPCLFIPSREVLSTYEGFASLYKNREVAFDETYYDLCVALGLPALRGPRGEKAAKLIKPIESALGGKVVLEGQRFYVKGRDGDFEAHLVSEGFRKIAMLARLITNGALAQKGVLFWDEPEANLNPQLARVLIDFLSHLAQQQVQIFLATHDTLVAQRLSLISEYGSKPSVRFIGLFRDEGGEIHADSGAALSDLQHNPLLEEFTRFHEDESKYFADSIKGKVRT